MKYRFQRAVEDVSFSVASGDSLAILGRNGAGKTSTIRAILGMIPYQGEVRVFGEKTGKWRGFSKIGFAPEDSVPPEFLSASEYLGFIAELRLSDREKRKAEVEKWLHTFELSADKRIRDYSKGMKRKIVLAQAFVGRPEFLILDEPLNGLDPVMIIKLREVIQEYRNAGGTLLYCSHILSEVEKTCSRALVLDGGKKIVDQPVTDLVAKFGSVEEAFAKSVQTGEAR